MILRPWQAIATILPDPVSPLAPGRCHGWGHKGCRTLAWLLGIWLWCSSPAGALAVAPPADTAPSPTAPSAATAQPDAGDIPSEAVSQFVAAYLAVLDLIEQREADLQRAETEAESLQVQRDIQNQAFQLIQEAGLTLQQYRQLLGLANTDADFRERVLAQVEEASLAQ